MKSQRKPQGTSCQNYIDIQPIFPFLGRGFCIENITGTKQSYLKHSPEDYRKSIDHNNNEEKYDNIKNELMVYLFHLTNLFADVVVYRWFLLLRFESGIHVWKKTVKIQCKIQVYLFCLLFVFPLRALIGSQLFSFFCLVFCVDSGVYSFLLVFAPSLAFLCCFIFITAFVVPIVFIFCMFQRTLYFVVFQFSGSLHFGPRLAQFSSVLFSYSQ